MMTLSHQAKGKYPKCSIEEGRDMYYFLQLFLSKILKMFEVVILAYNEKLWVSKIFTYG